MWEEFSCILQGYGAEESMDNILQTQDLCTYEESSSVFWSDKGVHIQRAPAQLEQYGYDRARFGLKPGAVPYVPLHINEENEDMVLLLRLHLRKCLGSLWIHQAYVYFI